MIRAPGMSLKFMLASKQSEHHYVSQDLPRASRCAEAERNAQLTAGPTTSLQARAAPGRGQARRRNLVEPQPHQVHIDTRRVQAKPAPGRKRSHILIMPEDFLFVEGHPVLQAEMYPRPKAVASF